VFVANSEQDDDGGDEGEDVGRDDDGAPCDQGSPLRGSQSSPFSS